eukprot:gb/GEZJ01003130.1/.p1 GENE.gb/GEZJ01003130.1/~~gb/GEZJ01003130.1/.p1  ORF type:complete len:157 (+),score=25.82 gb/GEZJ01003130.1/:52-471(+)
MTSAPSARALLRHVRVCRDAQRAHALLPVSYVNVPELRAHFPRYPVVPAVVLLRAMVQLAAALRASDVENNAHAAATAAAPQEPRLAEVRSAAFRSTLRPHHRHAAITVRALGRHRFEGVVSRHADAVVVAEATFQLLP